MRLKRRERISVCCIATAAVWCLLALLKHDLLEASWMTVVLAIFAAFEALSAFQVSRAPGSTVLPSPSSPAALAGFSKNQIWQQ